jgi:rRNA-processing protein FCF1
MKSILVDTSSIVFALSNNKDIFAVIEEKLEAKVVISQGIVRELQRLGSKRNKEGRAAKLAMEIMRLHDIEVLPDIEKVDDFIVKTGAAGKMAVCTNDLGLKKRLLGVGVRALSVSQKGILR